MRSIKYWFPVLFLSYCCQTVPIQNEPSRPNILFIMVDDLGYADLGSYGQKRIHTPNLDRLALEGMRFSQCYAGSPVCAPSRSVLMTGRHTGHTTVRGNFGKGGVIGLGGGKGRIPLHDRDTIIPEILQSVGYKTAMVGKWGLGEPGTSGEPNRQGFDEFYGFLNQRRAHSYYVPLSLAQYQKGNSRKEPGRKPRHLCTRSIHGIRTEFYPGTTGYLFLPLSPLHHSSCCLRSSRIGDLC